ncbi:MAG TPA: HAD hydrolase-like protein, partial [Micromonosporaceae bacterium]|nr:HAD hydrolase-like protein [Micromonosporaceae bacterium]
AASDAGDARSSKPDPDILAATLTDLGLPADRVVLVGDTAWDAYAAGALDIPCVALSCGGASAAELREAGAVEVYADPAGLRDRLPHSAVGALRPGSH